MMAVHSQCWEEAIIQIIIIKILRTDIINLATVNTVNHIQVSCAVLYYLYQNVLKSVERFHLVSPVLLLQTTENGGVDQLLPQGHTGKSLPPGQEEGGGAPGRLSVPRGDEADSEASQPGERPPAGAGVPPGEAAAGVGEDVPGVGVGGDQVRPVGGRRLGLDQTETFSPPHSHTGGGQCLLQAETGGPPQPTEGGRLQLSFSLLGKVKYCWNLTRKHFDNYTRNKELHNHRRFFLQ